MTKTLSEAENPMTDTDVSGRLPAQPSTTDLNLWLVSRLKREGSELTFGQIASIAKDLSAALRSPGGGLADQICKAISSSDLDAALAKIESYADVAISRGDYQKAQTLRFAASLVQSAKPKKVPQ